MSIGPEERSWLAPQRKLPRKEIRVRPYTLTQLSDHVDDMADAMEDILVFLAAIRSLLNKSYKWGRVLGPMLIGALLASGVITGPLGKVLTYLGEHWPK